MPNHLEDGAAILVDKPSGWTSFDVVNKLRWELKRKTGIKRYKVGHAGTLDPLATGLLIICIGKYTKLADQYQAQDKTYEGVIRLFRTTPTYDAEQEPDCYYPYQRLTKQQLNEAAGSLTGMISQLPPMYSAIKKNGVPLYRHARRGKEVAREPRRVNISSFTLSTMDLPDVHFEVGCSKGTYIRSLAYDYGRVLQTGAYLHRLRRTFIGRYSVEQAYDITSIIDQIEALD
ncbi:MAG: tRNA pseudouridine(55) synthase TruB [Bacteroidota bacterium]